MNNKAVPILYRQGSKLTMLYRFNRISYTCFRYDV